MSNIGNILSVLIFLKKSWRKNVCVFYFLICLLFNLLYINSCLIGAIFITGYNIKAHNFSRILCKLYYYVSYVFTRLSSTTLILASIDRLLLSSTNVDMRLYSSKRLAYFSVSISTSFWIIFYIHALIKVDIQETYPTIFICYYDVSGIYFKFVSYSSLVINITICVTLIILAILSFKNVRKIQYVPRQQRQQFRTMNKKDFQLLRCLYIYDIVYIIFSICPSIIGVYISATRERINTPLEMAIQSFVSQCANFMHLFPYCVGFLIFISISKAFRQEVKRLGYKICGKDLMTIREEENRQKNTMKDKIELNVMNVVEII